jgi:hypothetical protein
MLPIRPEPPAVYDTVPNLTYAPTWSNHTYGDCTVAARANQCLIEDIAHAVVPVTNERLIIDEYFNLTEGHDQGLALLTALKHWRRAPFLNQLPLHAFVRFDADDVEQVKFVVSTFGTAYVALWLPLAWKTLDIWDTGFGPSYATGSWGGHCVEIHAYSKRYLTCFTWGCRQLITWSALAFYCDEAYAVLGPDWSTATMPDPHGLDLAALNDALAHVTSDARDTD